MAGKGQEESLTGRTDEHWRPPSRDSLADMFFHWRWTRERIWALETPVSTLPVADLLWQLKLPVWTTVPGEPRFDLAPETVLADPDACPPHWQRILHADIRFPIEMFQSQGQWLIFDGYHRLAWHTLRRSDIVAVRLHSEEMRTRVCTGPKYTLSAKDGQTSLYDKPHSIT